MGDLGGVIAMPIIFPAHTINQHNENLESCSSGKGSKIPPQQIGRLVH